MPSEFTVFALQPQKLKITDRLNILPGTGGAPPECDEGTDPTPASTERRRRGITSRPGRALDSTGRLGTEPSGDLHAVDRRVRQDRSQRFGPTFHPGLQGREAIATRRWIRSGASGALWGSSVYDVVGLEPSADRSGESSRIRSAHDSHPIHHLLLGGEGRRRSARADQSGEFRLRVGGFSRPARDRS